MPEQMPILLVPGLNCSPRLYAPQMPELWRFGPVTVADHTRDETIAAIAERILGQAPPRFALAGLSMGGYIALEIVRQATGRVAKLALLDTGVARRYAGGNRQAAHQHRARGERPVQRRHRSAVSALRSSLARERCRAEGGLSGDVPRRWAAGLRAPAEGDHEPRGFPAALACHPLSHARARRRRGCRNAAERFPKKWRPAIPGAKLVVVPECGHLSTMERPEAVTKATRRLDGRMRVRARARDLR